MLAVAVSPVAVESVLAPVVDDAAVVSVAAAVVLAAELESDEHALIPTSATAPSARAMRVRDR